MMIESYSRLKGCLEAQFLPLSKGELEGVVSPVLGAGRLLLTSPW
jgi:hypothetical protein